MGGMTTPYTDYKSIKYYKFIDPVIERETTATLFFLPKCNLLCVYEWKKDSSREESLVKDQKTNFQFLILQACYRPSQRSLHL